MNNWFSAVLLFEAQIDERFHHDGLCELSIRLIQAPNKEAALEKAQFIGVEAEHNYLNETRELVSWKFRKIVTLQALDFVDRSNGAEVFSSLFRKGHDDFKSIFVDVEER